MPFWRSIDPRARTAPPLFRFVPGLTLLLLVSPATGRIAQAAPPAGAGFTVEHAALRAVDGRYVADVRIDFAFSEDNREAMRNGVALTVIVDIEVRRERGPLWNETLAERKLRYRIETNVLTERYLIRDLVRRSTRHYRSFEEMVDALGRVESVPVAAGDRLPPGVRCTARVRARLDIEALPSPLRPLAYFSPQWRLSSGWFEWPVER